MERVNRFTSLLLTVILCELMLGGGGRLIAWGPISLRMVLFALALLWVGIQILRKQKISQGYWTISFLFMGVLVIGLFRGVTTGASPIFWWEDVKPLLYFFMLPFFGFVIQGRAAVELPASCIKSAGIILSGSFIVILILIHSGVIPFLSFYNGVMETQEFFFRGEVTFFFKGFLYICIAFLFVHFDEGKFKKLVLVILAIGMLVSLTRGFLFAIPLTYSFYYFLKSSYIKVALLAGLSLSVVLVGQYVISQSSQVIVHLKNQQADAHQKKIDPNSNMLGNRSYSDEGRFQQIKEVTEQIDLPSFIIGHGFGMGTPSRPIHMEISYLEIFHKQGLIGLAFWAYLLWVLYQKYKRAAPGGLSDSFFFGSLFVYFQSLTNQYINNPIGLGMILLSLVCLDQLKEN